MIYSIEDFKNKLNDYILMDLIIMFLLSIFIKYENLLRIT